MILVPFTAVGTSLVKSNNANEYDLKPEEESDQDNCITCNSPFKWYCNLLRKIVTGLEHTLMHLAPAASAGSILANALAAIIFPFWIYYGGLYVIYCR